MSASSGSKILVAVRVPGAPEEIFDLFTRDIALWWKPNELFHFTPRSPGVVSFEGGEGGRFIETLPGGKVFEIGRISVWQPGIRLVFGWRQASFRTDQSTEVDVSFEAVGEETRVTVEHRGWDSVPQEHVARHRFPNTIFLRRHGEWWQTMLANLNKSAAHPPPSPRP